MRRFGALAVVCGCLLAGCDGGGGSDPTSPDPPANVAGTWAGTGLLRSAGPAGNCVADFFQAFVLVGFADNVNATVTQSGAAVTLRVSGLFTPDCSHSGMVSGSSIAASSGTCDNAGTFTCGTLRAEARSGTGTFTATVSGNRMTGTRDFVLNTFDLASGASLGAVTVRQTVELDRQ